MKVMRKLPKAWKVLVYSLATFVTRPKEPGDPSLMEPFAARCRSIPGPRVLELGTKRSVPERSTRHDFLVPHATEYLGTDIEPGADVDMVADVHRLSDVLGEQQFDVVISFSTFEHLKYPHLAAHQLLKVLKIGGVLFIQTHQTFPLHAYPCDYFRYSREALAGLFGTKMGFRVIATGYEFPAMISSRRDWRTSLSPSFLNVCLFGEKVGETPKTYVYEFDV